MGEGEAKAQSKVPHLPLTPGSKTVTASGGCRGAAVGTAAARSLVQMLSLHHKAGAGGLSLPLLWPPESPTLTSKLSLFVLKILSQCLPAREIEVSILSFSSRNLSQCVGALDGGEGGGRGVGKEDVSAVSA